MPDITAIVTAYRRPQNMEPLAEALRRQSVPPTAIWCWANDPSEKMKTALAKAKFDRVVSCSDNARFHGRFALALLAQTEFVAIFDDDSIPGDFWFANCLETMVQTPGILGTAGVELHELGYTNRTMHGWQRPTDKAVEVDLVGQAWFLRTEWLKYLFAGPPVTGTNGEDIELAARAWRLAGIRSFCPPHPANDTRKWGSTRGLELGLDEMAASRRVEHLAERKQIVEAEMAAGWKPLFARQQKSEVRSQETEESITNPPSKCCGSRYSSHHAPRDVGVASSSVSDEEQPAAAVAEANHFESYAHSVTECGPQWVTQYSYPTGDHGEAMTPARVSLRWNGRDENSWCLDCIDDIESLADRETVGAIVPQYDNIDLGPALNHVRDPLVFLRRANRLLKPGGELVSSVTNVRRTELIERLIHGRWADREGTSTRQAEPNAILRFYTEAELEKLFYRAGFHIGERVRSCSNTKEGPQDHLRRRHAPMNSSTSDTE